MSQRRAYRLEKALRALRALVDNPDSGAAQPLPSIADLARWARVSYVTMWKAVDTLRCEGRLHVKPGGKIFKAPGPVAPAGGETPPPGAIHRDRSRPLWRGIMADIKADLLRGTFPAGVRLPGKKELMQRYGVSYKTLQKALESLASEGMVRSDRRAFTAPELRASSPATSRIVVVLFGKSRAMDAGKEVGIIGGTEYLRMIETTCRRYRTGVEVVKYCTDEPGTTFKQAYTNRPWAPENRESVLGYLVYPLPDTESGTLADVLHRVAGNARPVALYLHTRALHETRAIRATRRIQAFHIGITRRPGRDAARFLQALGHRTIAYVSPYHASPWSRSRYEGLCDIMSGTRPAGRVVPLVLDRREAIDYLPEGRKRFKWDWIQQRYLRWKKEIPELDRMPLDDAFDSKYSLYAMAYAEIRYQLQGLFARALSDDTVTAWVGANDGIAGMALDHARNHTIAVPGRLSILGFDDLESSREKQLTSYNFNIAELVESMILHVLRPGHYGRSESLEITGEVVARGSTGPARGGRAF